MDPILLNGLVALGTGIVTSTIAWFTSKKKYYSEVDGNNILNMKESLDFYIKLSDDYRRRLEEEIESHKLEVGELKKENLETKQLLREQEQKFSKQLFDQLKELNLMKNQILSVYGQVCLNLNCATRVIADLAKTNKSSKTEINKK